MTTNTQDPSLTINTSALEATMAMINARPDLHHQGAFMINDLVAALKNGLDKAVGMGHEDDEGNECGTAACFAGWVGTLYGDQYGYQPYITGSYWITKDTAHLASQGLSDGLHVGSLSSLILGITDKQANVLYDGSNTRLMLSMMVKDLINTGDVRSWDEYREEDFMAEAKERTAAKNA